MSTQINITVDSGGLSRKAKQQTVVNRLLKMEDDHQKKVGKEATDKREAALKAKLLGPDGKPLYGVSAPAPVRKEEPAAFRGGVYEWTLEPTATTQTDAYQFTAVTKNAKVKPLVFTASNSSSSNGLGNSTSGPNGHGYSLSNTSRGGDLRATSADFQMKGKPDFTFESYVRSNGTPEFSGARFSIEHYVWILGENYFTDGASSRRHYIWTQYKINAFDPNIVRFEVHYERRANDGNTDGVSYVYDVNNSTGSLDALHATPGFNLPLRLNQWFHVAISRKAETWYFFLNGILAAYGSDVDNMDDSNANKTTINGVTDYVVSSSQVDMAKTRFIRKALYTSNFTPP